MKKYLLLLITLASVHAHADWERILDETTYSIASDGERLYAATEGGIYFSRDDGDTWRPSDYKDGDVGYLTASPYAVYGYSSEHHILRSVTKGNTWHPINAGFNVRLWENGRWGKLHSTRRTIPRHQFRHGHRCLLPSGHLDLPRPGR